MWRRGEQRETRGGLLPWGCLLPVEPAAASPNHAQLPAQVALRARAVTTARLGRHIPRPDGDKTGSSRAPGFLEAAGGQ